jgi:hypothetical protein
MRYSLFSGACISHDFHPSVIFSAVDLLDSQKFGKLKKAFENSSDGTASTTTPSVTTTPITSSQTSKKTAPSASGIRKRKAAASIEATKDLRNKKAKQAEEESGNDADLDTEEVSTASPGGEEAEEDQVVGVKLEEE